MGQTVAIDPLDALAAQHGAAPSPPATAPTDPLDALATSHGATLPVFRSSVTVNGKDISLEGVPEDRRAELVSIANRINSGDKTIDPDHIIGNIKAIVSAWAQAGPHAVVEGLRDMWRGNYARGGRQAFAGAGVTAAPFLAPEAIPAVMAAPVTAATGTGIGLAASSAGTAGAKALGATDDQAALVGDAAGVASGIVGVKLGRQLEAAKDTWLASRVTKRGAEAVRAFQLAVPANKTTPYTPQDVDRAMPYLDVEHASKPINSVESARDAADRAVSTIEDHISKAVQAHPNDVIRTKPLDAVRAALGPSPRGGALEVGLKELNDLGLDQPLTIEKAEAIRRQLNAENQALLKKNNYDAATAKKADPAFAARDAAAKSLRDGIYDQLEYRGIAGVRELRQDEGALLSIRNAAEGQIYRGDARVAGTGTQGPARRAISDLTRVIPKGGPYLADVIAQPNRTRDQLVERAFKLRTPAAAPVMPAIPPDAQIRGLLPAAPVTAGPVPDASYVRGVPAVPQSSGQRALPPGRPPVAVPAPPDESFVRGVPAVAQPGGRLALPAPARQMPSSAQTVGELLDAKAVVVRDPRTGRMRRIYVSEGKK